MSRQRDILLPSIVLDHASATPLHQQLCVQLARAIRGVPHGTRLASTRLLARLLGVSRNTVLAAYEELVADGLIEGRPGSGMRIAHGAGSAIPAFNPRRVMQQAQYPARTICVVDPDGTPAYLVY